MPPKIKELEKRLLDAGFIQRSGKGSHRNYKHPDIKILITISGKPGSDAKRYQEKEVARAIDEVSDETK